MEKFTGFKTRDGKFFEIEDEAKRHEEFLDEKEASLNKVAEAVSILWTYKKVGIPPSINDIKLALTTLSSYECGSLKFLNGLAKTDQFKEVYNLYNTLKQFKKEFLLIKDYI